MFDVPAVAVATGSETRSMWTSGLILPANSTRGGVGGSRLVPAFVEVGGQIWSIQARQQVRKAADSGGGEVGAAPVRGGAAPAVSARLGIPPPRVRVTLIVTSCRNELDYGSGGVVPCAGHSKGDL